MDKKRILIIDDEENFCRLVKKNVEKTGEFEVDIATSGQNGILLAKEIKPDLILLDVMMPEMDGGDVVSLIKKDNDIKDTPVVFLTAIVREEETDQLPGRAGRYKYLSKTVSVAELIACIKLHVRK